MELPTHIWTDKQSRGGNLARDSHITCSKNAETGEWSPLDGYSKLWRDRTCWISAGNVFHCTGTFHFPSIHGYMGRSPSAHGGSDLYLWPIELQNFPLSQEDLGASSIPKGPYSFPLNWRECQTSLLNQILPQILLICPGGLKHFFLCVKRPHTLSSGPQTRGNLNHSLCTRGQRWGLWSIHFD